MIKLRGIKLRKINKKFVFQELKKIIRKFKIFFRRFVSRNLFVKIVKKFRKWSNLLIN